MYTNVHCSTVYNSKDLEPTQMPIDDRLGKCGTYTSWNIMQPLKKLVHVLCRDMNEAENHHSQETNTGTENQTLHVLPHKWVLYNENK